MTCVVLDVSTPDRQGIEVLRRLAERATAPPVIVLTGQADIGLVVEAMKLRAIDLIEKPYQPESLLGAVGRAQILAGEIGSARQTRREAAELVERLTRRQQQVLHGIARGEPNKIIAWKLGLSVRTVESTAPRSSPGFAPATPPTRSGSRSPPASSAARSTCSATARVPRPLS